MSDFRNFDAWLTTNPALEEEDDNEDTTPTRICPATSENCACPPDNLCQEA